MTRLKCVAIQNGGLKRSWILTHNNGYQSFYFQATFSQSRVIYVSVELEC